MFRNKLNRMIILGVSKFTQENPFTEERQKPYREYYEKVEKELLNSIKRLIEETALKHNAIIIPIIEKGEINLVMTIDMSKVHL